MFSAIRSLFRKIRVCRSPAGLPPGTIVLFPVSRHRLHCGLAGIVEVVRDEESRRPDTGGAAEAVEALHQSGLTGLGEDVGPYAGGEPTLAAIEDLVATLRRPDAFPTLYRDEGLRAEVLDLARGMLRFVETEGEILDRGESLPPIAVQEEVNRRLVRLKDAAWALEHELLANVEKARPLAGSGEPGDKLLRECRKTNLILNAIDRLEIRGRDSAGVLVQVRFEEAGSCSAVLDGHREALEARTGLQDLPDRAVTLSEDGRTVTIVYKVAAEVGNLGDNVAYLRGRVIEDDLLRALLADEASQAIVMAHTRWASNGIINIANCHPLDNESTGEADRAPRVHVALNGDIDNYQDLKKRFEKETGRKCSDRITTDAKVIALWIDYHLRRGADLETAFLRSVSDFEGSAAILMVSDLDPGRLYMSLKGSGQSLYTGLSPDSYLVASEIYGLVEETSSFVKLEGERPRIQDDMSTLGQVFVLDSERRRLDGVRARHFDGEPLVLSEDDLRTAEITSRDVDRGEFRHFFLKEISQSSASVAKTLRGKFAPDGRCLMGTETIPEALADALSRDLLDRILVVGQGTASVAAMAVSEFLSEFLRGTRIRIEAMKATELSGFRLEDDMSGTLVIAVTQSGATADTNRAVDLARQAGALTLAIVNRRNSDVTFKTAGVIYTSDGRDVEMSVASTKAFHSQVVAGALLALALGGLAGALPRERVVAELADLRRLPALLDEVFASSGTIEEVAARHAPSRRYWSVVGSGPNRIAAEEVRIKLSELCYKSISADSVEDKKHIDLSAEAMLLVLAGGHDDAVLSDLAKDVAIFRAHRAIPVVFTTRGEGRFDDYAEDVIELPPASPLLSMLTCTMAGHLFGYHAARAIDEGGRFLGKVRAVVVESLERPDTAGLRELSRFQRQFHERLRASRFASAMESRTASELTLLLKYAAGEIPPTSFETEFGREPLSAEIHAVLLERLVEAVDQTIRPIDAIKHQAKIVTVGTSRIAESPTGLLFEELQAAGVKLSSISFADRMRLREVQPAVGSVEGVTLYEVTEDPEGGESGIRSTTRTGAATEIVSRAEGGTPLKGTKRSVVRDRRLFLGVGAKDGRRIAIIPILDQRFAVATLALLHLEFVRKMDPAGKREILGNRYDDIVNGVTEADIPWSDELLGALTPEELITQTPGRIAERIVGLLT